MLIIETGVLLLHGNRTYAAAPTGNNNKKYYKCISRNNHDLPLLIPYVHKSPKGVCVFNKVNDNLYIIYEYDTDAAVAAAATTPIIATLKEVIGPVKSFDAFLKYEMCSRNIYNSLSQHNKYILSILSPPVTGGPTTATATIDNEIMFFINKYNITTPPLLQKGGNDKTMGDKRIITIDPKGAMDLDDAFTINVKNDVVEVSIYISLVAGWLDYFDNWRFICDEKNLRVSTIYLPNGEIRPLFPNILCHSKMSLISDGFLKPVLTTTLIFNKNTFELIHYNIYPELIHIYKNYVYDSSELMNEPVYCELMDFTFGIINKNGGEPIQKEHSFDSHKLVEYWMIQTGLICGKEIRKRGGLGIYRECLDVIDSTNNLLYFWKSYKSKYVLNDSSYSIYHKGLSDQMLNNERGECYDYVHITSPIRRWVDIWNQNLLLNGEPNKLTSVFILQKGGVDIINNKMNQIKKMYKYTNVLYKLINNENKRIETIGHTFYSNDKNKWKVFIPEFNIWGTLYVADDKQLIERGGDDVYKIKCSILLFESEFSICKKVKIMYNSILDA